MPLATVWGAVRPVATSASAGTPLRPPGPCLRHRSAPTGRHPGEQRTGDDDARDGHDQTQGQCDPDIGVQGPDGSQRAGGQDEAVRTDRPARAGMPSSIASFEWRTASMTTGISRTSPISKNIGIPMIAAMSAIFPRPACPSRAVSTMRSALRVGQQLSEHRAQGDQDPDVAEHSAAVLVRR